MKNLQSISGLDNLETSSASSFEGMFFEDPSLQSVTFPNTDTSNVTDMSGMFSGDKNLKNIDLSKINTSNVTDMSGMFQEDYSLKGLDVSNFNTSNVTDMGSMFDSTGALETVNLSNFNTSKVTDMANMFRYSNIKKIDLSNFDTANVTNMSSMFEESMAEEINVNHFKTTKVTNMWWMFSSDIDLVKLDLSSFDTSNVYNFSNMFEEDRKLTTLNLSNFSIRDPEYAEDMFTDTPSLNNLTLGDQFNNKALSSLTSHSVNDPIPGSNPLHYAANAGWQAVHPSSNLSIGSIDNPQGVKYDTKAEFVSKRPSEKNTYVWQSSSKQTDQYTLDVNKTQDLYQGQTWDPTSAITSATKNGTDDKSNVTITNKKDGNAVTQDSVAKLNPGTYDLTYKNGDKTSTLTLTIKPDLASLKTANIDLYLNKSFKDADLRDNIDSKDSDGNPLNYQYTIKDASGTVPVDQVSSKKGQYTVEITTDKPKDGKGALKGTLTIKVTDRSTLNLKYTTDTITVGQSWKPEDAFKNATNAKGDNLAFKNIKVTATYGKNKPVKDLSSLNQKAGTYTVHYVNGSAEQDLKLIVQTPSTPTTPTTPTTPVTPSTPTTSSSSSSSSSNSSTSSSTPTASSSSSSSSNTSLPSYAAAKGTVVYSINKIGLYRSTKFSAAKRSAWYTKKPRVYRPMFVVTGYKRAANGTLRYQVRDVNHTSKTNGKTGYITASQKYVRPVYYATKHSTVTVINPRGANAYRKANLTKKARSYRQGTVLHVKRIVTHNLTTRYVLSNDDYITANRKLVNMGRHKQVKSVKTKRTLNRYSNANFTKKNQVIAKNRTLKVYGYDYSQKNNVTKHGTLRYRVAGGYITANTKYVRVYK
ncbi:BspA family leucine-rich repeat surface protein [Lentilactobacillus hilgardii]|nr:BspA family leucine-rich repeat surface protein [Lentilactobacillus hilgardii]